MVFFLCKKGGLLERGKRLLGLLIIVVSIVSLISWEKWGRDRFLNESILVLRENVPAGTLIEDSMLEEKPMGSTETGYIEVDEKWKIVGMESAGFIHKGMPLYMEYFCDAFSDASEKNNRIEVTVEDSWLFGMPRGIKRGDQVFFYHGKENVLSAHVSRVAEDGKSFGVIVQKDLVPILAELVYEGEKLVVSYY